METLGGGWERVIHYNSTAPNATCPGQLLPFDMGPHHLCYVTGHKVRTAFYTPITTYSEVIGLIVGYVNGTIEGFRAIHGVYPQNQMHKPYMDGFGLFIDPNWMTTPRKWHIYSVTAIKETIVNLQFSCPTLNTFYYPLDGGVSHMIGKDYRCIPMRNEQHMDFTGTVPAGLHTFGDIDSGICKDQPQFCRFPSRYFYKQLPQMYVPNGHINQLWLRVMSSCVDASVALSFADIYVR